MEKIKKILVFIWIFGLLIAMYTAEAWSYIYLRHHGSEHPKENLIFGILLLCFIVPFALILILNKIRNKGKPKQKAEFTWSGLGTSFIICSSHDFLQSRAMKIVNAARNMPTAANMEKAGADIIKLYCRYFAIMVILCIVIDIAEKKYKQNKAISE